MSTKKFKKRTLNIFTIKNVKKALLDEDNQCNFVLPVSEKKKKKKNYEQINNAPASTVI